MEIFGRNAEFWSMENTQENTQYRNMVNDPYLFKPRVQKTKRNFCACGLNASGEEPAPVQKAVTQIQAWNYLKTGLALVGVYALLKHFKVL